MSKSNQPLSHNDANDADPMIDALMAEVVPSDEGRRIRPPDLTAKIIAQLASPQLQSDEAQVDEASDADPVIDTLLAEILPGSSSTSGTAGSFSSPPDLSAKILDRLATEQSDPSESQIDDDAVIDGLMPEVVPREASRRVTPPDLVHQIVSQLPTDQNLRSSVLAASQSSAEDEFVRHAKTRTGYRIVTVVAGLAAAIIVMVVINRPNHQGDTLVESGPEINAIDRSPENSLLVVDQNPDRVDLSVNDDTTDTKPLIAVSDRSPESLMEQPEKQAVPIQGIPMESSIAVTDSPRPDVASETVERQTDSDSVIQPIELVAAQSRSAAEKYWSAIGVTPTPEPPQDQIANRFKNQLGVSIDPNDLTDPQKLRDVLAADQNAREIAQRWLASTTAIPARSFDDPANRGLVNEIVKGVSGSRRFDETLVSLIDGTNEHSQQWYDTIGRRGPEGIAKHLAGISINADVRCVRCHDSHIGRSGTQDDYWSFVALVRNFIHRKNGRWTVQSEPTNTQTFYELLDGRQKVASPKVSAYLLQSDQSINDFKGWTQTLLGSEALAAAMVDSLWKIVHGRPLRPSPVDAFTPPVDQNLNDLHALLSDDLNASGFDLSRTLALIIASPMARRSVPLALRDDALLTATDQQRAQAFERVGAFAAVIDAPRSRLRDRLDVALRRTGGKLSNGEGNALLAQPIFQDPKRKAMESRLNAVSFHQQLAVDFPGDDASLPVSWLRSIKDFDRQVQHLVYLSGRAGVTPEIEEMAQRLKESGPREAALSRIWWVLRQ